MTIGDNIKYYRKIKGLTQEDLAKACDLKTITIRQYESGKRQPRPDRLEQIAKLLGISISELYHSTAVKIINGQVYSGSPDSIDDLSYIDRFKKFCELLSLDNVQWEKTEKDGVDGLEFTFDKKENNRYFLTKEQTFLLPEVAIEQAKALIRSLDRQNRRNNSPT